MTSRKEYVEFKEHIFATTNEIMDLLDVNEDADLKGFDVTITINNKSITVPSNADVYANVERLVNDEIEELDHKGVD